MMKVAWQGRSLAKIASFWDTHEIVSVTGNGRVWLLGDDLLLQKPADFAAPIAARCRI
jgi:hypothetical protein